MLFAVTLTYLRPAPQIQLQLDAHKQWLQRYIQAGTILVAGPLHAEVGGFILAHAPETMQVRAMLAQDPFVIHRLVEVDIQACEPAIRAVEFPAAWAGAAKAVQPL
ncbi:YciI family protein [Xanthomonas maliensis]|uniref:YciI family protein n=1 Tax=Xanthomonas maliensis TaxID=1321368 RepID=UPI00039B8BDB|nr:YciI family protein [Xanthomonas maliensis]KAB7769783.1 hypothetical protein CKY51_06535 [Xanthomonas maliensis]